MGQVRVPDGPAGKGPLEAAIRVLALVVHLSEGALLQRQEREMRPTQREQRERERAGRQQGHEEHNARA